MPERIAIRGFILWLFPGQQYRSSPREGGLSDIRVTNLGFRIAQRQKVRARVLRGASWTITNYPDLQCTDRTPFGPMARNYTVGFRIAKRKMCSDE